MAAGAFDQDRCGLPFVQSIPTSPVIKNCNVPDPPDPIPPCLDLPIDIPPPIADVPCPAIDIHAEVMTLPIGSLPRVTVVVNNVGQQQNCDQQCHLQLSFLFQLPSPQ